MKEDKTRVVKIGKWSKTEELSDVQAMNLIMDSKAYLIITLIEKNQLFGTVSSHGLDNRDAIDLVETIFNNIISSAKKYAKVWGKE